MFTFEVIYVNSFKQRVCCILELILLLLCQWGWICKNSDLTFSLLLLILFLIYFLLTDCVFYFTPLDRRPRSVQIIFLAQTVQSEPAISDNWRLHGATVLTFFLTVWWWTENLRMIVGTKSCQRRFHVKWRWAKTRKRRFFKWSRT